MNKPYRYEITIQDEQSEEQVWAWARTRIHAFTLAEEAALEYPVTVRRHFGPCMKDDNDMLDMPDTEHDAHRESVIRTIGTWL